MSSNYQPFGLTAIHTQPIEVGVFLPNGDKCIANDYSNLVKAAKQSGQNLEDMLYLKYPEAFVRKGRLKKEYRGISDIIHGISYSAIDLAYGHYKDGYWTKKFKIQKETFAQYGRMYFEENENVLKMLQDVFPETTEQIESIISVIARYGV